MSAGRFDVDTRRVLKRLALQAPVDMDPKTLRWMASEVDKRRSAWIADGFRWWLACLAEELRLSAANIEHVAALRIRREAYNRRRRERRAEARRRVQAREPEP